ncbi:CXXC zinc finger domain protein [Ancylostoma ceylanicum]|uniref:CXXC zinc finger domain protein n=1 Tax=Ancylostoma ceylanicum TaxID=53326 RepID=A0A0D6LGY5_9BILA|nr:CXXC zinc finger domain protein [Ancylostoma ceylanicum]
MDQVNGILWMLLGDRTTSEGANNSPDGTTQAATNVAVTKETTTTTETFSAPAGLVAMFRCGECIGCFQTDDCGKCDGCAGGQPCFKRKCVQESILMQRHNRALAQKAAPRKETSEAPKKDAKQDAATSATKRGPGRPRKDGHPPNARGVGAQHANGDENMDERQPARRPTARAQTSRRRHEAPKQLRLLMMLPEKVEQYYKEQPQSELQALEELRAIDQKIGQIQVQTETMLGYVRTIQRYVMVNFSSTLLAMCALEITGFRL